MRKGKYFRIRGVLMLAWLWAPLIVGAQTVTYSGRGEGADVNVLGLKLPLSDTGPLAGSGGSLNAQLASFQKAGILDLRLLTAGTTGAANRTYSQASIANATVTVPGVAIAASVLTSNATTSCDASNATATGSSGIAGL